LIHPPEQPANLVDRPRCVSVAFDRQALQVFGETELEAGQFQLHVGVAQHRLTVARVLRPDQRFEDRNKVVRFGTFW
jgi:hypothetical protein